MENRNAFIEEFWGINCTDCFPVPVVIEVQCCDKKISEMGDPEQTADT